MGKILLAQDKANHAFYGLLLYCIASLVLTASLAVLTVVIVALSKEVWDRMGHGTADTWDFVVTVAPVISVYVLEKLV